MEQVFIIHGLNSSPNKAWRPWLMSELAKENIYTCALPMPGDETPVCSEWIEKIQEVYDATHKMYLVGHSLGARAVLKFLEQSTQQIEGVVIVSGRYGKPKSADKIEILGSFYDDELDFEKIKFASKNFVVIHGDNDPNVPYEDGKKMAASIGCELITIVGGGHLSGKAGWNELPEARDGLLSWIRNNREK